MRSYVRALTVVSSALAMTAGIAKAQGVADFYKGKTLTLVSGFTPNGENDIQFRLLGRHIGKYLPGNPQTVVTSMPGAGTMLAANHLVKAPADGTVISTFTSQAGIEPFLGNSAALFDPLKLSWIGSMSQDRQFCALVGAPDGVKTFDDLRRIEVTFGSSAPSTDIFRYSVAIKNLLDARMKMVLGYAGMPGVRLALDRGEVNGVCAVSEMILRTTLAEPLKEKKINLIIQMGRSTTDEFGIVPSVFDFTKDQAKTEMLGFFFRDLAIGRPIAAPAGVPVERLAALRKAVADTLKDEVFLSEAQRIGMSVSPVPADEIQTTMESLSKKPKSFYEDVKRASE